jgi:hypothetical protein
LTAVRTVQKHIRDHVLDIQAVAHTLAPENSSAEERQGHFDDLAKRFALQPHAVHKHMVKVMTSFRPGLFGGGDLDFAEDNLELERWFRLPKGHERRIHGRRHTGVRIVQEGPTLLLALDAHLHHDAPFTRADLVPYRHAEIPDCQRQAVARRKVMRKARSKKRRPTLLASLEARYQNSS